MNNRAIVKLVVVIAVVTSTMRLFAAPQTQSQRVPGPDTPSIISDQPMPKLSGSAQLIFDSTTARVWCTPDPRNFLDSDVRWFKSHTHTSDVGWVKVHLTIGNDDSPNGWAVVVRDGTGNQVDSLEGSDFQISSTDAQSHQPLLEAITQRISGNGFRIELHAANIPAKLKLCVRSYEYESDTSHIEVKEVTHKKDLRTFVQKTDANYGFGRPVAAVYFPSASTKKEISCTGFAVTDTLFITNYHCISAAWQIRTAFVRFNFELNAADPVFERKFVGFAMPPNATLDFTVLRLNSAIQSPYIAKLQPEPLTVNKQLVLFQHPDGLRKKVASSGCQIDVVDGAGQTPSHTDFYHSCDSSGGSSGSPVMDPTSGIVVGVHHLGTYDPDSQSYHNLALSIQLLINNLTPDVLQEVQKFSTITTASQ